MSRTPRVDAFIAAKDIFCDSDELFDFLNFAANLEQMLDAALAENETLKMMVKNQRCCQEELAEMRAEIEQLKQGRDFWRNKCEYEESEAGKAMINYVCQEQKKNKLIEQMREALHLADDLIDEYAADYEHRDNVDEIREEIKAALTAERGE